MNVLTGGMKQLGHQQITSLSSATSLTVPVGTSLALITVEVKAVRWRDDGTNPTAAVGFPMAVGDVLLYDSAGLAALKFIEQAASATIDVAYYGPN